MNEIREILDLLDMEYWLDREGLDYKVTEGSRGTQLNVKECPVCENSNWKVYLNAESGLGNCFAGDHPPGENFNKWSFIRATLRNNSTSQVFEHIKQVAKEQGWRPPRKKSMGTTAGTFKLPRSVKLPYKGKNLKYLTNRNITDEITEYFSLSYCHRGFFDVQDFSNRIIIPIYDMEGTLKTFQGRDITGKSERKYLFPKGLPSSGTLIYNGHNVRNTTRVVVGEGVFDVMALKIAMDEQMELRDVIPVGTFGKHLSTGRSDEDQLHRFIILYKRGVKEITFMWDSEKEAIKAAVDSGLLLKKIGFNVRIAILPKGRDPNEVPPSVVQDAFWKATFLNDQTAATLKLRGY